jgi:GNAT superfamily N-acetyltransferase
MADLSGISIKTFRGDFEALEKMALTSWREEYGAASFPNFYRPAFLHYLTDRISDKRHLIAAYRGDEVVAFMANLPQTFKYREKTYRAVYSCLLVARKEYLRRGLATALIQEGLRVNENFKYDFSLLTLEKGHGSTKLMRKMAAAGHPMNFVKKIRVIARILDLARVNASETLQGWERAAIRIIGGARPPAPGSDHLVREYRPEDLDECLDLLNSYQKKSALALVWSRDNLSIEVAYPGVSQTLVLERNSRVEGLINFICHEHLGKTTERWAWVNHVAYPGLSGREQTGFVNAFLRYAKAAGCIGAIEWTKGYYPQGPFYRAHFFPYFRSVNMVSWSLNPEVIVRDVPAVYEIQV